jgi:hypothetical protein
MPAPPRRSSTASRSAFSALTRRSSGAGAEVASTQSQNSSPSAAKRRWHGPGAGRRRPARRCGVDGAAEAEPRALALVERSVESLVAALPAEDREAPIERPPRLARLREMAPQRELAQQREDAVGEGMAVARAERALGAKEVGDDAVGGMLEAQHAADELGLGLEQGLRMHRRDYPKAWRADLPLRSIRGRAIWSPMVA